jgi:excisionase family DNA binding protein
LTDLIKSEMPSILPMLLPYVNNYQSHDSFECHAGTEKPHYPGRAKPSDEFDDFIGVAYRRRVECMAFHFPAIMHIPLEADTADPVLTTAAAARLLGVAVSTTQLWLESGALPSWKTPGGHRRVRTSAVLGLLARGPGRKPHDHASATPASLDAEFRPLPAGAYPCVPDEAVRLTALRTCGLVDTPAEAAFDRLTWLASQLTDCPVALITLLTARRQWFKSRLGMDMRETPREWAFCNHAVVQAAPFVVDDTARDPRFADNPLVTGAPHVRFYAGVALRDGNGQPLGALCVMDREPRRLRERELKALQELAAIAEDELRHRT